MAKPKGPTKKKATATEPFLLTPRGYKAWRDALEKQGRSPRSEFREAAVIIFRIVEWSALTGAVWAIGFWVGDQFILGAATFLFVVLALYTTSYIRAPRLADRISRLSAGVSLPARARKNALRRPISPIEADALFLASLCLGSWRGPFRRTCVFLSSTATNRAWALSSSSASLVHECAKSTKVLVISALVEASAIRRQLRAYYDILWVRRA